MFKLRCPKCGSSRVRRGYEPPPLALRLILVKSLLCDNCNLLYRGFAPPWALRRSERRRRRGRTKR